MRFSGPVLRDLLQHFIFSHVTEKRCQASLLVKALFMSQFLYKRQFGESERLLVPFDKAHSEVGTHEEQHHQCGRR